MAEKITFEVLMDNGKLKVQTKDTKEEFDGLGKSAKKANKSFANIGTIAKVAGVAAVAAISKIGQHVLSLAAKFEKTSVAFETMLGGGKNGKKAAKNLLKDIQKFAAATPLSFEDLVQGSKRLLAFGTHAKDIIPTMKMLGDASQGNAATLDRVTLAYGKVQSRGKTTMEELNSITEAGVPIIKELAENFGVTKEELFKMSEQGKISFDDLKGALQSLTGEGGQFSGMMEKMASTLSGKWSTFKDNMSLVALEIGNKLLPTFKKLLDTLANSKVVLPTIIAMFKLIGRVINGFAKAVIFAINAVENIAQQIKPNERTNEIKSLQKAIEDAEKRQSNFGKGTPKWKAWGESIKSSTVSLAKLRIEHAKFIKEAKKKSIEKAPAGIADLQKRLSASLRGEKAPSDTGGYGYENAKSLESTILNSQKRIDTKKAEIKVQDEIIKKNQKIIDQYSEMGETDATPDFVGGGGGGDKKTKTASKSASPEQSPFSQYLEQQDTYLNASMNLYDSFNELSQQYYAQEAERVDANLEHKLNANEEWYLAEKDMLLNSAMDAESRDLALAQLETEKEKKDKQAKDKAAKEKSKIAKKAFKQEQASGIASVWIAAAVGVMQGFAQLGPIGGAIMAALTLATAGVQTGVIASQKPPAMATGTADVPSDMLAQIHEGEGVIPKTFMDSVNSGEISIGQGSATTYNVAVEGSVITENELFDKMDVMRNERSQELGQSNYGARV